MNTMGLFYRPLVTLLMVFLVLAVAAPLYNPAQASPLAQTGAPRSDDFNACAVNNTVWTFENPANITGATPKMIGQYTGEAYLSMEVPAGASITFSDTNRSAPRLMQKITDNDFEVEARFTAPINSITADWKIMGILVRDASQAGQTKWFRFDVNARNGGLNAYLGYINAAGALTHIFGPGDLPGSNPVTGPITIRVKYTKATGAWDITYVIGNSGAFTATHPFIESTYDPNFVVTDIGVFVGSTGVTPPGHIMKLDSFRNVSNGAVADDAVVLTLEKVGTGTGIVNWPMTNVAQQCSGNQITLSATASPGSQFTGWTGDVTPITNNIITITMDRARRVIASFNLGTGQSQKFYLPILRK